MRFQHYACHDQAVKKFFVPVGEATLEIWRNNGARTLLFYPGTMLEPGHYQAFLYACWRAGLTIAGIHLKGHGLNKKLCRFTFQDMLEQGLEAQNWLENNGFGQIAISGHSQGGILTLAHASASRSLAAAFAIDSVFPDEFEAIQLTHFAPFAKHREKIMAFINKMAKILPFFPVILPMYLSLGKILAGGCEPLLLGSGRNRLTYPLVFMASLFGAKISKILKCPFYLFASKSDRLFTPAIIEATYERIIAPEKELIWLAGGGHLAPLNPEICAEVAGIIGEKLSRSITV